MFPFQTAQTKSTIAMYIKRKRLESGLSKKALAEYSGLSVSTISKIENGSKKLTKDNFDRLQQVIPFHPDEIADLNRIVVVQYVNEVSQVLVENYPE